ncbi:MAG: hypothetical protein IPK82_10390 [Polyangiaceae bacterium]|nr:hypothetical protein [Polyangiaceae bacterium]
MTLIPIMFLPDLSATGPSEEDIRTNVRRVTLRNFAIEQFKNADRAEALCNVVAKAAELVETESSPAHTMMGDLKAVIVGDGYLGFTGRYSGKHYMGGVEGSEGFRPELQGAYNQHQHAIAGVLIGYNGWYAGYAVLGLDVASGESQDVALYKATIPLGIGLDDSNYKGLAKRLRCAISALCE